MNSLTITASSASVPRSRVHVVLAVLGCIGVLTPFLPFTWGTSPLDVFVRAARAEFSDVLLLIAAPSFLAILVSIAYVRAAVFRRFSRLESMIASVFVFAAASATLTFTVLVGMENADFHRWIALAACWIAFASGIALAITLWRQRAPSAAIALVAMQCAYIANALFCLIAFWPEWQIGAILAAITVGLYVAHVALLAFPHIRSGYRP